MPGIEDKFLSFSATTDRDQILIRLLKELYTISGGVSPAGGLATEATLISVLNAIVASDQDIEILLVRDTGNSDEVVQQITDYTTGIPTVTYKDVNGAAYIPVGPLEYLDPSAVLNLMLSEMLDQGLTLDSVETLLTTIDGVLDSIKLDTANLDVALSTRASEATLLATNALLTTIDTVLDTIKTDTAAMAVDLAAIEVLITTTNSLLTTIDGVLDTIKVDTGNIATDTSTLATPVTALPVVMLRVSVAGAGSVTPGKRRVSFFNAGNTDAQVAGAVLKRGESVTFSADGLRDTLAGIIYNCLTSELLITTVG